MENNLLHTPVGVRDIYSDECAKKIEIQNVIRDVMKSYAYDDIQTPTFEFFDIFNKERGSVASKNMYKFFDREGNTLVLRPDITPSIARAAAKYYLDEEFPIRLSYIGNTFINNNEYQGKLKEITQIGAELIGDTTSDADAELVAMVIKCLLKTGLTEFQVEIGHVNFFKGLLEESGIDESTEEELRVLISNKNNFGVEELLKNRDMSDELKNVFSKLPELFGGAEILDAAGDMTSNKKALDAIDRLKKLYSILSYYGVEKYVTFDLGMLSHYNYYTGIIFNAYTYGTGDAIVNGGRYDNLLKQFGKKSPSIGFGIIVDQLMVALSRQKINVQVNNVKTMILYKNSLQELAVGLAGYCRKSGDLISLIRKSSSKDIDEYIAYARRSNIGGILYIENDETIKVINAGTGDVQIAKISEMLGE